MGLFSAINATRSGLGAQRVRMDVVASNVANIDTTRSPDGEGPYTRKVVRFSSSGDGSAFSAAMARITGRPNAGVVLTSVTEDTTTQGREVYDPSHPDANEDGFVQMPNVDLVTEMTDLVGANRSYQANTTVLNALKQMALRALDIGSR
jgi:flagellar basal-body rod protein FlgC